MPTYVPIDDSEIDGESPVTVSLMTRLRDNALAYAGASTGTRTMWQQTAAPVGWTKDTTYNDYSPRVISGSVSTGGSVPFSTLFGRTAVDSHTLTTSQIPSHNHTVNDPGHSHPYNNPSPTGAATAGGQNYTVAPTATGTGGASTGISIGSTGGGTGHVHNIDMRVKYIDNIIATKS